MVSNGILAAQTLPIDILVPTEIAYDVSANGVLLKLDSLPASNEGDNRCIK